jgi:hypothetical protein
MINPCVCNLPENPQNVVPQLVISTHDSFFHRLGIVVTPDHAESIDVLAPDGTLLMRLNIFNHVEGWASIDVILTPKELSTYKVLAFNKGEQVLNQSIDAGVVSIARI